MSIVPCTDPLASPAPEPAYFVITTRDEVYTADAIPMSKLKRMGYGVGDSHLHGDQGLFIGGNLVGQLFLEQARLLEYVAAYTSKAKEIPCEIFAWGMV